MGKAFGIYAAPVGAIAVWEAAPVGAPCALLASLRSGQA